MDSTSQSTSMAYSLRKASIRSSSSFPDEGTSRTAVSDRDSFLPRPRHSAQAKGLQTLRRGLSVPSEEGQRERGLGLALLYLELSHGALSPAPRSQGMHANNLNQRSTRTSSAALFLLCLSTTGSLPIPPFSLNKVIAQSLFSHLRDLRACEDVDSDHHQQQLSYESQ